MSLIRKGLGWFSVFLFSANHICLMCSIEGLVVLDSSKGIAYVILSWVVKDGLWQDLNLFSLSLVGWFNCSSSDNKSGSQRHSKEVQGSSFNLHATSWVRLSSYPMIHQQILSGLRGEHRLPHASLSAPTYQHSSPSWHKGNGCDSHLTGFR